VFPARLLGRLCFFVAMEPPPKRPRLGHEQCSFVFQSTTPTEGQRLYKPKLLQLIDENGENKVVCDGSPPHGSWMQKADELTIIFHHKGEIDRMKECVFRLIEGTEAWVQVKCHLEWRSVLIPSSTGSFQPM
jgi:hypothetical protein